MHGRVFLNLLLLAPAVSLANTLVVNPAIARANDTNAGSDARPLRTIARAAALAQPGDVIRIHAGVYREKVTVAASGTDVRPIRFEAAPGASVTITGADPLAGWSRETDGTYSTAWTHRLHQGDNHNPGGAEQVFIGLTLLRKVLSLGELTVDTFFVDPTRERMYLRPARNPDDAQAERPVEASTRSEIWIVTGANVHLRGLHFRAAANRAQQGMVQFRGARAVVEDCTFEWANSTGATFLAADITVRNCVFQDNGQQGFSGNRADRLRLQGCTVQRNNVKNYPRGWEAGGNKICRSRGVVYEQCRFLGNHGSGVWFDISNEDCTVRNCLIADNEDAGIFYEISYGLHAHDNVILGNGWAKTKGAWGANGGICVSSSPGCVIERNLIAGNEQGFCFREQNRTAPPIDGTKGSEIPIWNHDEVIRENLILYNRTAQVQGWFDIATERHWPKVRQTAASAHGKAADDLAADYRARNDGVPTGLSLENLKLRFEGNVYAFEPGQPFFIWGANWKRKQIFNDLPDVTAILGFEDTRSRILPALPVDLRRRDFRLPGDMLAAVKRCYPQGQVPDCALGPR